jgi:hypothetical protein
MVLALMLPAAGLYAFAIATAGAITTHVVAMLAIPGDQPPLRASVRVAGRDPEYAAGFEVRMPAE